MNVWGWIVLYVVLFVGLQLLIYRYLRSDDDAALVASTPSGSDGHVPDDIRRDRILEEFSEAETNSNVRRMPALWDGERRRIHVLSRVYRTARRVVG